MLSIAIIRYHLAVPDFPVGNWKEDKVQHIYQGHQKDLQSLAKCCNHLTVSCHWFHEKDLLREGL